MDNDAEIARIREAVGLPQQAWAAEIDGDGRMLILVMGDDALTPTTEGVEAIKAEMARCGLGHMGLVVLHGVEKVVVVK